MTAEIAVLADEPFERVTNGRAFDLHNVLFAGKRAKGGRNQNAMGHIVSSRSKPEQASRISRRVAMPPPSECVS
jgi:hypothetical protein